MRALLVLVGVFACLAVLHVTVAEETALAKREATEDAAAPAAEDDHKEETAMTGEKEDDEEKGAAENVGADVLSPGGRAGRKGVSPEDLAARRKAKKMARQQERKERKQEMKNGKKEGRRNKKKDLTPEERQALRRKKKQMKKERRKEKKEKGPACQSDAQCDGGCCVMKRNKAKGFCKTSPQKGDKAKCRKSCHCADGLQCFIPKRMAKRGKTVGKCLNPSDVTNKKKGYFLTTPVPAQPTTEQ